MLERPLEGTQAQVGSDDMRLVANASRIHALSGERARKYPVCLRAVPQEGSPR